MCSVRGVPSRRAYSLLFSDAVSDRYISPNFVLLPKRDRVKQHVASVGAVHAACHGCAARVSASHRASAVGYGCLSMLKVVASVRIASAAASTMASASIISAIERGHRGGRAARCRARYGCWRSCHPSANPLEPSGPSMRDAPAMVLLHRVSACCRCRWRLVQPHHELLQKLSCPKYLACAVLLDAAAAAVGWRRPAKHAFAHARAMSSPHRRA